MILTALKSCSYFSSQTLLFPKGRPPILQTRLWKQEVPPLPAPSLPPPQRIYPPETSPYCTEGEGAREGEGAIQEEGEH